MKILPLAASTAIPTGLRHLPGHMVVSALPRIYLTAVVEVRAAVGIPLDEKPTKPTWYPTEDNVSIRYFDGGEESTY